MEFRFGRVITRAGKTREVNVKKERIRFLGFKNSFHFVLHARITQIYERKFYTLVETNGFFFFFTAIKNYRKKL